MLSSDLPIAKLEEDELNRGSFAESLAKTLGCHPQMFRFPRLRRDDFYLCHVFHFPVSFLSTHKLPHDPQNIQHYSQTVCGEYFSLASLLA